MDKILSKQEIIDNSLEDWVCRNWITLLTLINKSKTFKMSNIDTKKDEELVNCPMCNGVGVKDGKYCVLCSGDRILPKKTADFYTAVHFLAENKINFEFIQH
jgi:hypothetical protein